MTYELYLNTSVIKKLIQETHDEQNIKILMKVRIRPGPTQPQAPVSRSQDHKYCLRKVSEGK